MGSCLRRNDLLGMIDIEVVVRLFAKGHICLSSQIKQGKCWDALTVCPITVWVALWKQNYRMMLISVNIRRSSGATRTSIAGVAHKSLVRAHLIYIITVTLNVV